MGGRSGAKPAGRCHRNALWPPTARSLGSSGRRSELLTMPNPAPNPLPRQQYHSPRNPWLLSVGPWCGPANHSGSHRSMPRATPQSERIQRRLPLKPQDHHVLLGPSGGERPWIRTRQGDSASFGRRIRLEPANLYRRLPYAVSERTREIGIRVALGARHNAVVGLVMRRGIFIAAPACCSASLAFNGASLVEGMLFGVRARDPLTFLLASVLLVRVALLACWRPARRAARIDPGIAPGRVADARRTRTSACRWLSSPSAGCCFPRSSRCS